MLRRASPESKTSSETGAASKAAAHTSPTKELSGERVAKPGRMETNL
jgi:hypothetical protein